MTLSAVLAAVLLGGIALTIRTALREMKLSAMKNEFVSNVSHELRTPLVLDPRLRRVHAPRPGRGPGEGPGVRRLHRDREPSADPADQQHPRLLAHRVRPQGLHLRGRRSRGDPGRHPRDLRRAAARQGLRGLATRARTSRYQRSRSIANAIDRAVANLLDNAVKYSDGDRAHPGRRSAATTAKPSSRSPTTASAFPATSRKESSSASTASAPGWCTTSRAQGSACRWFGTSPSHTAARSRLRARSARAAPSPFTCR